MNNSNDEEKGNIIFLAEGATTEFSSGQRKLIS